METTFYDDNRFRSKEEVKMLKRTMTLDLDANANRSSVKKQKVTSLLSSPDMHMLKLGSPELERLIISNNGLVTTTPTPTQFMFPKNVTEEQEQYARGFVDALVQLHHQNGALPNVPITTSASTYTTLGSNTTAINTVAQLSTLSVQQPCPTTTEPPVCSTYATNTMHSMTYPPTSSSSSTFLTPAPSIKEEPQTVPSLGMTPPLSPINMENQEKIKLERKRLRNRIAASKCRRRKLERIARLEDKVSQLKGENSELNNVAMRLREQVAMLKQEVMDHLKSGCQIMMSSSLNF